MEIATDYREADLLRCLRMECPSTFTVVSENLPVADVVITNKTTGEKLYIERKTVKDLSASIRDGRYKEQSQRLLAASARPELVFYLIEGLWKKYPNRSEHCLPRSTLISALFTLSTEKRFSVHKTEDCAESADWIKCVALKFMKTTGETTAGTVQPLALRRSETVTSANVESLMLAVVPGISPRIAAALLEEFGGLTGVLDAVRSSDGRLGEIQIAGSGGKLRKISSKCVKDMVNLLGPQ